jgi:hypothetical protein
VTLRLSDVSQPNCSAWPAGADRSVHAKNILAESNVVGKSMFNATSPEMPKGTWAASTVNPNLNIEKFWLNAALSGTGVREEPGPTNVALVDVGTSGSSVNEVGGAELIVQLREKVGERDSSPIPSNSHSHRSKSSPHSKQK